MASPDTLFGRSARLLISDEQPIDATTGQSRNPSQQGIEISNDFRFTFNIQNGDVESPNTAIITIYNLRKETRTKIIHEFDTVTLEVGYQNNIGVIFRGEIKQFIAGNEDNVTNFLEIRAADGDPSYNFGLFGNSGEGVTLNAPHTRAQLLEKVSQALGLPTHPNAQDVLAGSGGVLLSQVRGKVLFGLARVQASNMANTASARFSIQQGVVTFVPLTGYLPGTAVEINSLTGMIGTPNTTDNGIEVTTLINPLIKIGCQIKINNADITQTIIRNRIGLNQFSEIAPFIADATEDGLYRVLVAEHTGDTRGQDWYTKITALSLDQTANVKNSVKAFG
jgi:hypothetical protein